MVLVKSDGNPVLEIPLHGEGEYLHRIQKALLLGIQEVGSQCERSGDSDYQEAVITLSGLLRECMLNESQTNVGIGFRPYVTDKQA